MSGFLGFTERKNFGRALFPVNPMGEVVNFNELLIDEFAPIYGFPFSAWSCARRLWTGYTGNLIEVRRSTDNALLDIGYNSENELDTATLLGFLAGASGTVRTLYDQTGAGNHFQQTTLANQPRIVNAGVLETRNAKPSMFFDGTNDALTVASSTATYKWLSESDGISHHILGIVQFGFSSNPNAVYSLLGNSGFGSANIGLVYVYDDRASVPLNNSYRCQVVSGVSGSFPINNIIVDAILPNQLISFSSILTKLNASTPEIRDTGIINYGFFGQFNPANPNFSTSNATFNLQLGANGNNATLLNGYISELILNKRNSGDFANPKIVIDNQMNYYKII
jgi:hypothetical protein